MVMLAIAFVASVAVHLSFGLSLGLSLLIFFVVWPLVGTLVTADDDLPGGWSNPDGSARPAWRDPSFWGQVSAGLALASAGSAIDEGWRSPQSVPSWCVAASVAFLTAALFTRRWWLLAGTPVGLAAFWL
jgi:hypothetical protein